MFEQQKLDLERTCRTCKNECDGNRSIFSPYSDNSSQIHDIHEMLMTFADVQVGSGDGLPNTICELCLVQLHSAYIFKIQCENVDKALREYVKNTIEKDIKPDVFNLNGSNVQNSNDISSASSLEDANNQDKQSEIHENEIALVDTEEGLVASNDYIQILENNQLLLTCRECGKSVTTVEGLKCHKRIHSGLLFKCKSCDKKFSRQNHLQRHELTHSRKKVHVCRICNKTLTRLEHLKRHLLTHLREKPYTCPRCKKGFNREEILDNHMVRCKGDRIHICDICNKGFNRADSLEVHRSVHINQKPVLPTLENLDNIEDHYYEIDYDASTTFSDNSDDMEECFEPHVEVTESNDEKKIKEVANLGEDIYNNSLQLENHIDVKPVIISTMSEDEVDIKENLITISTNNTEDMEINRDEDNSDHEDVEGFQGDDDDINDDEFLVPVEEDSEDEEYKPVPEPVKRRRGRPRKNPIEKVSPKKSHRQKQNKKIKGEEKIGKYLCPSCTEVFNKKSELERHALEKHPETPLEIKFKCHICSKTFTTEKYRDLHVKGHTGPKKFQCKTCEKSFLSKSHLTEHMKFHNENSKKFLCSECGQRFIRNDYLVIHMRRHRGEKPFKCKFCGKGFPRTTDLTVHERYHTGEKTHLCTICGRGFGRAYNLTVHMRTHTGEKPYQCTYCDAAFAQGNDLKAHVRRHTGERFQCELCSESFLMGYLLTQHKRNVHGLNVVSNIRRLQPLPKLNPDNPDEPPPITIPLPKPVIPQNLLTSIITQSNPQFLDIDIKPIEMKQE